MNEKDKKDFIEDFKKADGSSRLDMWDFALAQQVLWEEIISEMQKISKNQGIDKKLEELMEEEMKGL